MKPSQLIRIICTLAILVLSVAIGRALWNRAMNSPWTRDGRIRADVINIAPDVSGIVARVAVKDNQLVHRGDLLFIVDQQRYRLALAQARAQVAARRADMSMRLRQAERRAGLEGAVVSAENREDARSQADSATALYQEALAALDTADLNLSRTEVRAPVDGYITNLNIHTGDFATAGTPKLALVDRGSFWVYGYFEETKLRLLHMGDPVDVRLLGPDAAILQGHVESISRGISDRDNSNGRELLADVNPVFNWVRLAQRVPVRVAIDRIPPRTILSAGMTCTVIVHPAAAKTGSPTQAGGTPAPGKFSVVPRHGLP